MSDDVGTTSDLTYTFGSFRLVPAQQLLLNGSTPVRLGSRALCILTALVERPGELIGKAELIARTWPDTIVEESNLKVHVAALRKALGEDQTGHRYVANITGRGYCFVAPVHHHPTPGYLLPAGAACALQHNLPAREVKPIGRADTLRLLAEQLHYNRLVTLLGPGGIGKTTVALAAAKTLLTHYPHGIWFVDIGTLRSAETLASALATALGLSVHSSDPLPALRSFLKDRHLLIILDSCEHLIDAAASLAEHVLLCAPDVGILATSRESLRIQDEHLYPLAALKTPPPQEEMTAARAWPYSAVQLFVTRAQSSMESFQLTDHNAMLVVDICRKLDGLALAIELTSTRIGVFSLAELSEVLEDKFRLLHQGRRSVLPRHRTLAATLEWSHDTLSPDERITLRRICMLVGAFNLDAARALIGLAAPGVIESIEGLVAKSLMSADVHGNTVHFRLLDTTRAYALQKLEESGELLTWQRRHAEYCRDLFAHAETEWEARSTSEWMSAYQLRMGDVRDALNWAFSAEGDSQLGIALTVAIIPLWMRQSLLGELVGWIQRALESRQQGLRLHDRDAMKLHAALGATQMYTLGLTSETEKAWKKALQAANRLDDDEYQLRALWGMAACRVYAGHHREGLQLLAKFKTITVRRDDPSAQMDCDRLTATALHYLGEQAIAHDHLDHLLSCYIAPTQRSRVARFQLDQHVAARVLLSNIQWLQGYPDQALVTARNALVDAQTGNHALSLGNALVLGYCPVSLYVGNFEEAQRALELMLDLQARHGVILWNDLTRCLQGTLLIMRGNSSGLDVLRDAVESLRQSHFGMRRPYLMSVLATSYGRLGDLDRGRSTVKQALSDASRHEELWCMPELLRVNAELLAMEGTPAGFSAAEADYMRSLDWARRQRVPSWELRAATGLAQLWQAAGQCEKAEVLLTQIFERFTEGFETHDLKKAHAVLLMLRAQASDVKGVMPVEHSR